MMLSGLVSLCARPSAWRCATADCGACRKASGSLAQPWRTWSSRVRGYLSKNQAGDAAASHAHAVVPDDVRVRVLEQALHGESLAQQHAPEKAALVDTLRAVLVGKEVVDRHVGMLDEACILRLRVRGDGERGLDGEGGEDVRIRHTLEGAIDVLPRRFLPGLGELAERRRRRR